MGSAVKEPDVVVNVYRGKKALYGERPLALQLATAPRSIIETPQPRLLGSLGTLPHSLASHRYSMSVHLVAVNIRTIQMGVHFRGRHSQNVIDIPPRRSRLPRLKQTC